ncbi:MAG TPA: pyridoxamine 5'-phosphate oxidase family protein [Vicinamibacterales bacterium]|nr:pyridoxamine 5'-phosphate oxidase family protein [Vicinamibacterales bacterium]
MLNRITLCLLLMPATTAGGQATATPAPPRAAIIAAARDVLQKAHYCTFVTIGEDGQPQARLVDPLTPDADFTIWIPTNPLTRKVDQIRRDARVTLLCFDTATSSYVTVLGRGGLVTDAAEKRAHWKADWNAIYPSGPLGTDSVLIRLAPFRLEIVSESRGMIGDAKTWRPLAIDFPPVVQDKPDFSGRWILVSADPPGPDVPRAMTVTQQLVSTTVRGEAMTPFFKDITIERETATSTRSETSWLGVNGGVVGGIVGSIPGASMNTQRSHHSVTWDGLTLVFEHRSETGENYQPGDWTERREAWSLEPDGRLRIVITTRGSRDQPRTVTSIYRRP